MTIQLISTDPRLYHLCREILRELPYETSVIATEKYSAGRQSDICIWDCENCSAPPGIEAREAGQKHLFLLERNQVATILDSLPCTPIGLLLKPITKTTLSTFLEQAVALCAAGIGRAHSGNDGAPPCDRDDILQYLLQANLRLQEHDQDRTNFLARAAHDFRAPLTALNGYCGLMLEGVLGPFSSEQKEVLQRMQRSAQRLTRLASSLYDLSIARRMQLRMQPQPHSIEDCVEQAIHELAFVAEERQISIAVRMTPPSDQALCFDPARIEQLLVNVLENACKFTPKFGAIEISGYPYFWDRRFRATPMIPMERRVRQSEIPNSFRLDIKDSGPAIPKALLPLIFEEYTSYSGPVDRSGAGLGLAICRTIARAHQGNIWVSSEADGATFSLVLPLQSSDWQGSQPPCDQLAFSGRI
jgi:signal transduction histidine kinase